MRYLVERLDSAVTIHDHDVGDPDCEIRLDFRLVYAYFGMLMSFVSIKP